MSGSILRVPSAEYYRRERGVVSKTALDQVHRSPRHYLMWLDGEDEQTPAMAFGAAFHVATLEPDRFVAQYAAKPADMSFATKEGKAWRSEHEGRIILSHDDHSKILAMSAAVRAHPIAGPLLRGGQAEMTLRWQDVDSGLRCQARVDYWRQDLRVAADLKSTSCAAARDFARSVAEYRYHVQHALYADGFAACGEPVEHFLFVAVEKTAPYLVAVYELDADSVAKGEASYREDLETLERCLHDDAFPGYPETIQSLSLPAWAA